VTCETIHGNGITIIACNRSKRRPACKFCGRAQSATKLCDYPLRGTKSGKTCSANMCDACAVKQPVTALAGDTIDFCPPHARLAQQKEVAP
jgi:uncharacterized protein YhfF